MGWRVDTEKRLVFDALTNTMKVKTAVNVFIVTNQGTELFQSGEVFCENAAEVFEAIQALKKEMIKKVTGKI